LSENYSSLLNTWAGSGNHDEVGLDKTILDPATHRINGLIGGIKFSSATGLVLSIIDHENLFVGLYSMEITHLTSTRNGVLDVSWVP